MSLQTLKKKSDAITHSHDHGNMFTINGGPKNLSYIGKTMRNSSVRTPFRGTLPVNYITGSNTPPIMAYPPLKAEMGDTTVNSYQRSVRNTRSMIATKYTWIRGQYPNAVTQPSGNLTSAEHTQNVGGVPVFHEKNQRDGRCTTVATTNTPCCEPVINQPSSPHNVIQRIIDRNASGSNMPPSAAVSGFSEYMSRLRATALTKTGDDKPFPFYMNSHCGNMVIYTTAPEWYTASSLLKCGNE